MQELVETAELQAFARTVAAKSLTRAASELQIPRATLGRRLARLEQRLATRLLRRTTRSVTLTPAGEALYRQAVVVLDAVGRAEASVRQTAAAVRGELRVSVPPVLTRAFRVMLAQFVERYPDVRVQVDFSTAMVDLQRGAADVVVRASNDLPPGVVARTLAKLHMIAVASPSYLAAAGTPLHRRDLRRHRCLMGFARGEVPETHWPVPGGGRFHVDGAMFSNDPTLLLEAALHHCGIAMLPDTLAGRFVARGELVHVLPGELGREQRMSVVYLERACVPPPVRAFVDAIVAWAPQLSDMTADYDEPAVRRRDRRTGPRAAGVGPPRR